MMATYDNVHDALYVELKRLLKRGIWRDSRNGMMRERTARKITLRYPTERFHMLPHRAANPFAQVAEMLWVLGGRNDIAYLTPYLSHAPEFSDDGVTWRAGYGPRLRRWEGTGANGYERREVDQVAEVLRVLHADPTSRRAVMSLWDPDDDYADSKDIPCNNWIQFLAREGSLAMHIVTRSNDVIWGWSGINTFEWSVLHEALACDLGMSVGRATFFAGSFHLYDRHLEKARAIVECDEGAPSPFLLTSPNDPTARIETNWASFAEQIDACLKTEALMHNAFLPEAQLFVGVTDPFLQQCLKMLRVYWAVKNGPLAIASVHELAEELSGEFRVVAQEWISRKGLIEDAGEAVGVGSRARELRTEAVSVAPEGSRSPDPAETQRLPVPEPSQTVARTAVTPGDICAVLSHLEAAKSASYGDSWCKHGEVFSILPNVLRKTDRIAALASGATATADELLLDTVADVAVYAVKWLGWQSAQLQSTLPTDFPAVSHRLVHYHLTDNDREHAFSTYAGCLKQISESAQSLEQLLLPGNAPADGASGILDRQRRDQKQSALIRLALAAILWLTLYAALAPAEWDTYAAFVEAL